MKTVFSIVALTLSQVALANPESKIKVTDSQDLIALLETMEEVASEGPSLAAMKYSQDFFFEGNLSECKSATKDEVLADFDDTILRVFEGGVGSTEGFEDVIAKGKIGLAQILPSEDFKICFDTTSGNRSIGSVTFYISENFRFSTELGFED